MLQAAHAASGGVDVVAGYIDHTNVQQLPICTEA
ncbi:MAG: hypothetical protein ACLS3M_11865 [Collinsella sp.]